MSYPASGSAFDRIEQRFQALTTTSTRPLTVSGFEIGHGLPDRLLPLHELRDLVACPGAGNDLKDAVWSVLVRRARQDSDTWGAAAAGVMIRGLRRIAFKVSSGVEFHRHDLNSEILLGFFEALVTVDPDARRLYSLLWWAAYRRGIAARQAELDASNYKGLDPDVPRTRRLNPPEGHPDLVLLQAVGDGVLELGEAQLIGDTRVEGERLIAASRRMGMPYGTCHKRRSRAEYRLARYLGHSTRPPYPIDDQDPPPLPVAA